MTSDNHNAFNTEQLSPLPIEQKQRNLPYGLEWVDLEHNLPGLSDSTDATCWTSHAKQGMNGGANSCIVLFRYKSRGAEVDQTVFIKQNTDPFKHEANKYCFLQTRGIPTPELLTVITREDSEVVIMEFLPRIGIEPEEAEQLLDLIARINAIDMPPKGVFPSIPGLEAAKFDAFAMSAITSLGIGDNKIFNTYKHIEEEVSQFPTALNHGELYFQQVGRTDGDDSKLVVFDVETMSIRPRFADVANVLASSAVLTRRTQQELFAVYLDLFSKHSGVTLNQSEALGEMRYTRALNAFQSLPWLNSNQIDGQLPETTQQTINLLTEDLKAIAK